MIGVKPATGTDFFILTVLHELEAEVQYLNQIKRVFIPKRELPKVRALVLAHMHSSMLHKCLVANLSLMAGLTFVLSWMFNSRR
jgi:hypothetical protein